MVAPLPRFGCHLTSAHEGKTLEGAKPLWQGLGLTVKQFFSAVSDDAIREFLDSRVLSVMDALCGGKADARDLRRIAATLVDFDALLLDPVGRRQILAQLPGNKRLELEERIGRNIRPSAAQDWSDAEIRGLRDFFGLMEERTIALPLQANANVLPRYGLFEHQRIAVQRLLPLLSEDDRRAVLHFPTGVGKTRTAMHLVAATLQRNEPSIVVWLASGRELLEQASAAFREAWSCLGTRPLQLGTMWGDRNPDLDNFRDGLLVVGLAKGWSVLSRTDPGWAGRLASRIRLVVFDEAHQSTAPTYRRLTEELTIDYRCGLLGLTATPGRTWADIDEDDVLADFFAHTKVTLEVPSDNAIEYLIDNGYLARPTFRNLFSEPGIQISASDLSRIASRLDVPSDIVEALSMTEQYVTAVLAAVTALVEEGHRRILVFAATVSHARLLAALLMMRGVRAAAVTADTPDRVRDREIKSFTASDSTPFVLVNFGVLTTGFDAPKASAVVIARPTQSLVLYSQMVGRAIRGPRAGGTDSCEVITVIDPSLPGFRSLAEAFLNWEDVWQ